MAGRNKMSVNFVRGRFFDCGLFPVRKSASCCRIMLLLIVFDLEKCKLFEFKKKIQNKN